MGLLDTTAQGVFVIAVTPFTETGALDLPCIDRMVDFYLGHGATGLTVLGMMGEAAKLTAAEAATVVSRVLARVAGRVPVVAGVSAPGLAPMRELALQVMDAGAAGVMVAPPHGLATDDQIYGYYALVAQTLGDATPFVVQDFPQSTGVQFSVAVLRRIITDLPGCVMLKHEDWPGLGKLSALRADAALRRIPILVGNGGLFLPEELARGADGAMTGFAYPEMMVRVLHAHRANDTERARDLFDAYLPLVRYEAQPGIGLAIRKHTLYRRGAIGSAMLRRPGAQLSAADLAELDILITRQTRRLQEIGA